MNFIKKQKQSFTLVELSVVIVIISIMLSTVLVSRSLIVAAKVNKIGEEYRMFNNSIIIFNSIYDCLPGDCAANLIKDLSAMPSYASVIGLCTAGTTTAGSGYLGVGTGLIESAAKNTCMMTELSATGFLNGINIAGLTSAANLVSSIPGLNYPYAKFSRQAIWDYRAVTGAAVNAVSNAVSWPAIAGATTGPLASWAGYHQLVLHSSSDNGSLDVATATTAIGGPGYAVPSSLAYRVDTKFDDGSPYTGAIASGRSTVDAAISVPASSATGTAGFTCSQLTGIAENALTTAAATASMNQYQLTNNTSFGCLITFLI